jgi:hypothetical protein
MLTLVVVVIVRQRESFFGIRVRRQPARSRIFRLGRSGGSSWPGGDLRESVGDGHISLR